MVSWPSPWGDGFPGWDIECSAMSTKYLGEQVDIHTGGVDNIFPHHEGEIAQSEGAFGVEFVRYWLHGQHLLADGLKMAKSAGNSYTLSELEAKGFEPLSFRYLCLTAHYRSRLNFTFRSLRASQRALCRLREMRREWGKLPPLGNSEADNWRQKFWDRVHDDLNLPGALAIAWDMTKSPLPGGDKAALMDEFDKVLGLELARPPSISAPPYEIVAVSQTRAAMRRQKEFGTADDLRQDIQSNGYEVRDARDSTQLVSLSSLGKADKLMGAISSSGDVDSYIEQPPTCAYSINLVASNFQEDVQRCIGSLLQWSADHDIEVVVVDSGSTDGTSEWLDEISLADARVRVIHCDHNLGWGAAVNVGIRQSRGRYIVVMDTSLEATGDFLIPLGQALSAEGIGVSGGWGVTSDDLRHFHEAHEGEVDAIEGYCMAFPRALVEEAGWMDEKYRYYRHADLDYSMAVKSKGYKALMVPGLPLTQHEHRGWTSVSEEERDRYSKRNFYRFLSKWGGRTDLLVHPHDHHD